SIAFHPGGKFLAAACADGKVNVWDLTKKEVIAPSFPSFSGEHNGTAHVVAFSPDGEQLATGNKGEVKVWDWRNARLSRALPGHAERTINLTFSPDGKLFASASWSGNVMVWDSKTGALLLTLSGHAHPVSSLAFSPDGQLLVSASFDRRLIVWDTRT